MTGIRDQRLPSKHRVLQHSILTSSLARSYKPLCRDARLIVINFSGSQAPVAHGGCLAGLSLVHHPRCERHRIRQLSRSAVQHSSITSRPLKGARTGAWAVWSLRAAWRELWLRAWFEISATSPWARRVMERPHWGAAGTLDQMVRSEQGLARQGSHL